MTSKEKRMIIPVYRRQKLRRKFIYKSPRFFDIEKTSERIEALEKSGMPLYDFQKESVQWLQSGKIKMMANSSSNINIRLEMALAFPEESHGTLLITEEKNKDSWIEACITMRPELKLMELKEGNFRYPTKGEVLFLDWENLPDSVSKKTRNFLLVSDDMGKIKNKDTDIFKKHQQIVDQSEAHFSIVEKSDMSKPDYIYAIVRNSGALRLFDKKEDLLNEENFNNKFFSDKDGFKSITIEIKEFLFSFFRNVTNKEISIRFSPYLVRVANAILTKDEATKLDHSITWLFVTRSIKTEEQINNSLKNAEIIKINYIERIIKNLCSSNKNSSKIIFLSSVEENIDKIRSAFSGNENVLSMTPEYFCQNHIDLESFFIIQGSPIVNKELRDLIEYKISCYSKRSCREKLQSIEWVKVSSTKNEDFCWNRIENS